MKPDKFDKLMDIGLKISCGFVAACIVAGLATSCVHPILAHAFTDLMFPDYYWDYLDYSTQVFWETTKDKHDLLQDEISNDINEGSDYGVNFNAWLLQDAFMHFFDSFYYDAYASDSLSNLPSTVSVNYSGVGGVYHSYKDNLIHGVTILGTGGGAYNTPLAWSDEFTVRYSASFPQSTESSLDVYPGTFNNRDYSAFNYLFSTSSDYYSVSVPDDEYFQSVYTSTTGGNIGFTIAIENSSSIYNMTGNEFISKFPGTYRNPVILGSNARDIELPQYDADPLEPWEYYNNYLLPYLKNTLNVQNNFLFFPDGYVPPVDPTEPETQPPTIPSGGTTINAPIILGAGAVVVAGNASFNVFAPINGYLNVDGIDIQFTPDGKVTVKGDPFDIPMPEMDFGGKGISVPVRGKVVIDGVDFNFNPDGTISIGDTIYNMPVGEPETLASDAENLVYKYEIPTMENLRIPEAQLIAPNVVQFSDGISWIFQAANKVYADTGLMPVVLVCLSLGFIAYAVWRIGG